MQWHFTPNSGMHMNVELTQRDDFVDENQNLASALVRESIQNSLDASPDDELTTVKFRWVGEHEGLREGYCETLFAAQLPHAEEAGLELESVPFNSPTALLIEDFGTSGLLVRSMTTMAAILTASGGTTGSLSSAESVAVQVWESSFMRWSVKSDVISGSHYARATSFRC